MQIPTALSTLANSDATWARLLSGAIGAVLLVAAGIGLRDYLRRYRKR